MGEVKHRRVVEGKIAVVAREVVEEFALQDPFGVTEEHVNAAYLRLWDWDKLSVELLTSHADVKHAIELAVKEARGAAVPGVDMPVDEDGF